MRFPRLAPGLALLALLAAVPAGWLRPADQPQKPARVRDAFLPEMLQLQLADDEERITSPELKGLVETGNAEFAFPCLVSARVLPLDELNSVVLLEFEVLNKHLFYVDAGPEKQAGLSLGAVVRTLDGRRAAEFETQLLSAYPSADFERHDKERSVFRKILFLTPGAYKVQALAFEPATRNLAGGGAGFRVPRPPHRGLRLSDVVTASRVEAADLPRQRGNPFLLGNARVLPNVSGTFSPGGMMYLYYQVLGDSLRVTTEVEVECRILSDGVAVRTLKNPDVPFQADGPGRIVDSRAIPLAGLPAGAYELRLTVACDGQPAGGPVSVPFRIAP